MKGIEFKVLSALVKEGRKSDRQIAKELGVSQPTVSRTRKRLEDKEFIKEYTAIPNFAKIGYQILAVTLVRLDKSLKAEEIKKARQMARETFIKTRLETVMIERGVGLGYDGILMSYHKDYTSYQKYMDALKEQPYLNLSKIDSFLINLQDEIKYRPLTFSTLAKHILKIGKEKEQDRL